MGRYGKIYKTFFTSSLSRELEFRANFFAKVLQGMIWFGFFSLVVLVIFRNAKEVAGWDRDQMFILAGTCFFVQACHNAFALSLLEIPEQVRRGTLDFVVTKPVDSQFWVSLRRFNFDRVGSVTASLAVIVIFGLRQEPRPDLVQWLAFAWALLCGLLLYYSMNLFFMTLAIWWVKVDNLWVMSETAVDIGRYPIDVFPSGVKQFFLFVLPLALFGSGPTYQLTRGFQPGLLLAGTIWTLAALTGTRMFWRYASRSYASASS